MASSLQPGILALGVRTHHYLEFRLHDGADPQRVREIAGDGLSETRATTGGVNVVVGFSKALWSQLGEVPADLDDFAELTGPDGFTMPATQNDVWVWISASATDAAFDTARAVAAAFGEVADLVVDQPGFTYQDSRDLSGFVDGTENPPITEAPDVVEIPDGQPGAGGSIVFVQRWVHDLATFHAHPVAEQERIIGRTKDTDEELDEDDRPESAHIARVVIEEDGEELEVFRRSVPYGTPSECGLMFVAFTNERRRIQTMLENMVGIDGPRDALTDWSTPVSGGYYYVPPLSELA